MASVADSTHRTYSADLDICSTFCALVNSAPIFPLTYFILELLVAPAGDTLAVASFLTPQAGLQHFSSTLGVHTFECSGTFRIGGRKIARKHVQRTTWSAFTVNALLTLRRLIFFFTFYPQTLMCSSQLLSQLLAMLRSAEYYSPSPHLRPTSIPVSFPVSSTTLPALRITRKSI